MSFFRRLAAIATVLFAFGSAHAQVGVNQPQPKLPTMLLQAGGHKIVAEIAATGQTREVGMMLRTKMGKDEGMLFVFPELAYHAMWMKNTLLPLSVAFIADDGGVVNIDDMKPQTLDSHCSTKPVRFVLEMNVGWFDKRGIKAGSKFAGEPFKK